MTSKQIMTKKKKEEMEGERRESKDRKWEREGRKKEGREKGREGGWLTSYVSSIRKSSKYFKGYSQSCKKSHMKLFQIKQEIVMINIQFTFQGSNEIPSYTPPAHSYSDLRAKKGSFDFLLQEIWKRNVTWLDKIFLHWWVRLLYNYKNQKALC